MILTYIIACVIILYLMYLFLKRNEIFSNTLTDVEVTALSVFRDTEKDTTGRNRFVVQPKKSEDIGEFRSANLPDDQTWLTPV
jgi:hypothetical protein